MLVERSAEATALHLGQDGEAYRRLFGPLVLAWLELESVLVGPRSCAEGAFEGERARTVFAGALGSYLRSLGGEIETRTPVTSLRELPPARVVCLDVTPRQLLALAGDRLPRKTHGLGPTATFRTARRST